MANLAGAPRELKFGAEVVGDLAKHFDARVWFQKITLQKRLHDQTGFAGGYSLPGANPALNGLWLALLRLSFAG